MRFTNTLRVALRALRRNTMRSMLTALGMIIGVAAVITMVSIGNGAKAQVEAQVASLGQNLITVMPGSSSSGGQLHVPHPGGRRCHSRRCEGYRRPQPRDSRP